MIHRKPLQAPLLCSNSMQLFDPVLLVVYHIIHNIKNIVLCRFSSGQVLRLKTSTIGSSVTTVNTVSNVTMFRSPIELKFSSVNEVVM